MRKILMVGIDITEAGDNWTLLLEKNDLFLGPTQEVQLIVKRSSRELPFAIPTINSENKFLKELYIETHDS